MRSLTSSKHSLIASQLALPSYQFICQGLLCHAAVFKRPSPSRWEQIGTSVRSSKQLCNTNFYYRSCCTSRRKARVANLKSLASIIAEISRGSQILLSHSGYIFVVRCYAQVSGLFRRAMSVCLSLQLFVCLYVRPSRLCILSKWINI